MRDKLTKAKVRVHVRLQDLETLKDGHSVEMMKEGTPSTVEVLVPINEFVLSASRMFRIDPLLPIKRAPWKKEAFSSVTVVGMPA